MKEFLSLTLPSLKGDDTTPTFIEHPGGIPTGGLTKNGAGTIILSRGILIILIAASILCIIFLLWGGIQWIMSSGDKNKIHAAQGRITYAIIGLVVMFLSFFIINFVMSVFGVQSYLYH